MTKKQEDRRRIVVKPKSADDYVGRSSSHEVTTATSVFCLATNSLNQIIACRDDRRSTAWKRGSLLNLLRTASHDVRSSSARASDNISRNAVLAGFYTHKQRATTEFVKHRLRHPPAELSARSQYAQSYAL